MEAEVREQYEACFKELKACPSNQTQQIFYICGKQRALEKLAASCGIDLTHKNIHTLAKHAGLQKAQ